MWPLKITKLYDVLCLSKVHRYGIILSFILTIFAVLELLMAMSLWGLNIMQLKGLQMHKLYMWQKAYTCTNYNYYSIINFYHHIIGMRYVQIQVIYINQHILPISFITSTNILPIINYVTDNSHFIYHIIDKII